MLLDRGIIARVEVKALARVTWRISALLQDRTHRCPEGGCRQQELVPARACQFTRQLGTISDGEGTSVDAYDDTLHIGVLQGILQIAERVFPGGSGNGEVVSFKL